jgi:predicted alpha/beta hydrolase
MNYDTRHNSVRRTPTQISAGDGRALHGTWFQPAEAAQVRGVVVVAPAMATPSRYYAAFAAWLADHGFRTLTFDHRGTESAAAMRAWSGDLLSWFSDARDVLDQVARETDGLPLTWVGHSLGGQMLPFVDHDVLDRAVTVASGSGYWRLNPAAVRWRAPLLWRGIVPVVTRVAGYYPGRALRILGDIPTGVARQWARWAMHRDYLAVDVPEAAERFAAVKTPLTVLSFTDDELMSATSINDLHDRFVNADQIRQRYSPAQLDVDTMGHHGFFRARHRALWDELLLPYLAA